MKIKGYLIIFFFFYPPWSAFTTCTFFVINFIICRKHTSKRTTTERHINSKDKEKKQDHKLHFPLPSVGSFNCSLACSPAEVSLPLPFSIFFFILVPVLLPPVCPCRLPHGAVYPVVHHHARQAANPEQPVWDWHSVSTNQRLCDMFNHTYTQDKADELNSTSLFSESQNKSCTPTQLNLHMRRII